MIDSHQFVTPKLDAHFYKLYPNVDTKYWELAQPIPVKLMFANQTINSIIDALPKTHDGIKDNHLQL